jgi:hypothetical protein
VLRRELSERIMRAHLISYLQGTTGTDQVQRRRVIGFLTSVALVAARGARAAAEDATNRRVGPDQSR